MPVRPFPHNRLELLQLGTKRLQKFCDINSILCPQINIVPRSEWLFDTCAYYRPQAIAICVEKCANSCPEATCRQWSWPGHYVDRTPYGVLAHELGHHCDVLLGTKLGMPVGSYSSNAAKMFRDGSKEAPITSYTPNTGEWFAEMFRLFVTNHQLLKLLRPRTHAMFLDHWKPVNHLDWKTALGPNVPRRIVSVILKKS